MPDGAAFGGLPPPGVSPQDWYAQQRAQMLASALMQGAMSPIEQPQTAPVHGLYVQPRVGPVSALSKVAEALMGRKAMERAMSLYGANMSRAMGAFENPSLEPGASVAPPSSPDEQSVQPPAGQTPPTVNPGGPLAIPGLDPRTAMSLYMSDPAKYAALKEGPEAVQLARLSGQSPVAAARGALAKFTAIELRPGGTMIDPVSGRAMLGADPAKGEYYAVGPDGQVHAYPITNDATIQAYRAGLTTAAQQANTPREIPMGAGRTAIGYAPTPPALGGQPGAAAGVPAAATAATSGTPPTSGPAVSGAPPGANAGIWSTVPKLHIPVTPGMSSDTYTTGNLEEASKKKAELVNEYGQAASLANQQLQYNQEALAALPSAEVGPMSEWLTTNRQRLIELGVPEKLIPSSGAVTPTLELNKYLLNAALQGARQIYGSRMTQNEVKLQTEEMSPSSHMTADAIRSLVQQGNIQAQYAVQRNADLQRYLNAGGDPQQFEAWYNTHRPISEFAAMQSMDPQRRALALQRFQQHPESRDEFRAKLGWDPLNWQQ
jgi:hypothetical protein